MKRVFIAFLIVLMAVTACSFGLPNTIRGSGNLQSKSYEVSGFDQVELDTVGVVFIEQGDSESLVIETDDNILPLLDVAVKNGTLTLKTRPGANLAGNVAVTYRLTVKSLSAITANSSGDLSAGPLAGERLEVVANASGDVTLQDVQVKEFSIRSTGSGKVRVENVDADKVQARLSASGDVEIAGAVASLSAEVDGSGSLRAGDLQAASAEVDLRASGGAAVWVVDALDVTISGSGSLSYYGDPRMTTNLDGSGDVQSLGDK